MRRTRKDILVASALTPFLAWGISLAAAERYGRVTFSGVPVPGASVVATQGATRITTSTDTQGVYRFADLADGAWTIRVEMSGFAPATEDTVIGAAATSGATGAGRDEVSFALRLLPLAEMGARRVAPSAPAPSPASSNPASASTVARGTPSPAPLTRSAPAAPAAPPAAGSAATGVSALSESAADGLLVNGSVNNGAASPFAQAAAFGNARPGQRSLYNGNVGTIFGTSALDARPYSFGGQRAPKPNYDDVQVVANFGGPVRFPGLRSRSTLFLGYQRAADTNATTQSALVPTALERSGDFSQSRDGRGNAVQIVDPLTGLPFAGTVIPAGRVSPQAAALLGYYPGPNVEAASADGRFNYQTPTSTAMRQDAVQARLTHSLNPRSSLAGAFLYQRTSTRSTSLFGFINRALATNLDFSATWNRRLSIFSNMRLRYQFTRGASTTTPYFSGRTNVSGLAGITGNNQDDVNWGPPALVFSSGIAGFSSGQYSDNRTITNALNGEYYWSHGRHYVTVGGDLKRVHSDVFAQQDARGTFSFSGASSGSDLADFLLGAPHSSAIAFGNPDKYLRSWAPDAYVNDDWRLNPAVTITAGLRWEYESPIVERFGRLANLDIAPGFTSAVPVVATHPVGSVTGERYPSSLLHPDPWGIQPRLGVAWRPVAGSSLVVRGGYGIYRNTTVYHSLALLLAQQGPLSTTASLENTPAHPLTLANGFPGAAGTATNTFAVDPHFKAGLAHNWQVSAQRDLPASLTIVATYLGTHGTRLMQESLPNTVPTGAVNPCPTCPLGFVYLSSTGTSSKHAGQLQVRRRLRNGFAAQVQYTLSTAKDDATAFGGASLGGSSIAQDWHNLDAEWAPSSFDQRHLVTAQAQYTSGIGVRGGALLSGWKGSLLKGWTVVTQLTRGSGLPFTPVSLTSVAGTGVTGSIRADTTGLANGAPEGYYLNPTAYSTPASGAWGSAGRNSVRGPRQFSLNAGIARTFLLGERLSLDWRLDATNVLNRVTYSGFNTSVASPQFGLPNRANTMRKLQSTIRLRF